MNNIPTASVDTLATLNIHWSASMTGSHNDLPTVVKVRDVLTELGKLGNPHIGGKP
jgi:hypothetical protein